MAVGLRVFFTRMKRRPQRETKTPRPICARKGQGSMRLFYIEAIHAHVVQPSDGFGPGRRIGVDDAVEVDVHALANVRSHQIAAQLDLDDGWI